MLKPQPPPSPADSTVVFQEALALLDDFYSIDGIDLVPEPWYGKLEPLPLPSHALTPDPTAAAAAAAAAMETPPSFEPDHRHDFAMDNTATVDAVSSATSGSSQPRRNRQREELLYLREEAVLLEQKMKDLRHRRQSAMAAADAMSQEQRDMMALWEKIASRQHSERQRVEVENAKLKELFSAQTRVAQELRRLLDKQVKAHTAAPSLSASGNVPRRRCRLHEIPDHHVFEEMLAGLEQAYHETDTVLANCGVNTVEPPFRTTQLKLDDQVGVRVELIGRRIVPFDVHEMSHAIWTQSRDGAMHPYYYFYDEAESNDDVMIRHCGIRAPHGDTSVDLHGKHCSRRFIEQDRVVITWRALLEPQVYSGVPTHDIQFRESGWVVLSRASGGACEVRMFRVIAPDAPSGSGAMGNGNASEPSADWRIYALIDFVSNVVHSQGTLLQQKVENALLENSLKKQMNKTSSSTSNSSSHQTTAPQSLSL